MNYLISPYAQYWSNTTNTYFDGEIIEQDIEEPLDLLKATRKALSEQEQPTLEVSISSADLFKIDNSEPRPHLGDTVTCIDPEMSLNKVKARITELVEFPYAMDKHSQPTISNVMLRDYNDIIADLEKSKRIVDDLFSNGKIRTEVFETVAKQAITDINNSKTELIYPPEGGILAQEKGNPLFQVRLTSAGLGISTDGWKTIRAAVTARGVLAETVVGQFGNFVSMLIGNGNDVTQINTHGIAAGHREFNSAPFRVDMQGNLIANKLTANYAQIRSSNFTDGAIVGSSINVGNGVFTVDSSGHMVANSADIRGRITASTFDGGTITGAKIRTAVYGERIELTPEGFIYYDSGNSRRVTLGTNDMGGISGHTYYNSYGQPMGLIYALSNDLAVIGNRSLLLAANGGLISLQGPVNFTSSVTGLSLGVDQVTGLKSQLSSLQLQIDNLNYLFTNHTHSVTLPTHNHGNKDNQNWGGTFPTSRP